MLFCNNNAFVYNLVFIINGKGDEFKEIIEKGNEKKKEVKKKEKRKRRG